MGIAWGERQEWRAGGRGRVMTWKQSVGRRERQGHDPLGGLVHIRGCCWPVG